jgi:hypothetical protein
MFEESKDGQTHYYNDGCGCPEHNEVDKRIEKILVELRDEICVGNTNFGKLHNWLSQKLIEFQKETRQETVENIIERCLHQILRPKLEINSFNGNCYKCTYNDMNKQCKNYQLISLYVCEIPEP